jgi:hypothetical protein
MHDVRMCERDGSFLLLSEGAGYPQILSDPSYCTGGGGREIDGLLA